MYIKYVSVRSTPPTWDVRMDGRTLGTVVKRDGRWYAYRPGAARPRSNHAIRAFAIEALMPAVPLPKWGALR